MNMDEKNFCLFFGFIQNDDDGRRWLPISDYNQMDKLIGTSIYRLISNDDDNDVTILIKI